MSLSIDHKLLILVDNYLMVLKALNWDLLNGDVTMRSVSNADFLKRVQIKFIPAQDLISTRLSQVFKVFLFIIFNNEFNNSNHE